MVQLKGNLMVTHSQWVQYSSVIVVLAVSIQVPIIIYLRYRKHVYNMREYFKIPVHAVHYQG